MRTSKRLLQREHTSADEASVSLLATASATTRKQRSVVAAQNAPLNTFLKREGEASHAVTFLPGYPDGLTNALPPGLRPACWRDAAKLQGRGGKYALAHRTLAEVAISPVAYLPQKWAIVWRRLTDH